MKINRNLFLHTADWHIGASSNIIPDYLNRQRKAIYQIYKRAKEFKCKIIIIAGDALHKHQPTREERDLLLEIILKMDDIGFKTIIMEGNHDREDFKYTNIHFLSMLEEKKRLKNTYVVENNSKLIKIYDINFLAIPKGQEDPNKIIKKYSNIENLIPIIHDTVKYSKADNGYVIKKGISLGDHKNVIYYALGHYHTKQKVGDKIYYSGSPIQHNFGEKGPNGFLLVNYKNPIPKFKSIKAKKLIEVDNIKDAPKNAWVRLISNDPTIDLPENIVDVTAYTKEQKPISINLNDITEGLPEFLAVEGLDKQQQQKGIQYIKNIMETL